MFAMGLMLTGQGCTLAMRPVTPEIHGLLIDKQTRTPVPNTQILLSVEGESEVKATSNDLGNFDIESKRRLAPEPPLWAGYCPPLGVLIITAAGYDKLSIPVPLYFSSNDRTVFELVPSTIMDDSPDNQLPESSPRR